VLHREQHFNARRAAADHGNGADRSRPRSFGKLGPLTQELLDRLQRKRLGGRTRNAGGRGNRADIDRRRVEFELRTVRDERAPRTKIEPVPALLEEARTRQPREQLEIEMRLIKPASRPGSMPE
jgi:hypothetical protein